MSYFTRDEKERLSFEWSDLSAKPEFSTGHPHVHWNLPAASTPDLPSDFRPRFGGVCRCGALPMQEHAHQHDAGQHDEQRRLDDAAHHQDGYIVLPGCRRRLAST